jgi:hypothetical protein
MAPLRNAAAEAMTWAAVSDTAAECASRRVAPGREIRAPGIVPTSAVAMAAAHCGPAPAGGRYTSVRACRRQTGQAQWLRGCSIALCICGCGDGISRGRRHAGQLMTKPS